MIRVEMERYTTRKRGRKEFTRDFVIREELWDLLSKFAESDEYCRKGQYDWNKNILYLMKLENLGELLKENCITVEELKFYNDFKKEYWGANIRVELIYVVNTFNSRVIRLTSDYAYFNRKDDKGIYKVKLSDKVKDKGVKLYDLVEITVLANQEWIVTDVEK